MIESWPLPDGVGDLVGFDIWAGFTMMRMMRFFRQSRSVWLAAAAFAVPAAGGAADPEVAWTELPRVPAQSPQEALASFRVQPGFHLELAAAEPLVVDPVAMAFDEDGRLYVVEMRGYSERREDKLGRVSLLEDLDEDGRYDRASVFMDGLAWPTAVTCWDGGVFVGATPDIWYCKDLDGDGVADEKRVVFTGFAAGVDRLNVQAMLNSLQWGPDQRIHGATSFNGGRVRAVGREHAPVVELRGRDFSFDPLTLDLRPESGGGQHGLSFDDAGRKFVCSNSRHLMQIMYEASEGARASLYALPAPAVDIAVDGPAAEVFRVSPDEPWRVVRTRWRIAGLVGGPVEGGGRVSGYFTGASGVTIYRGNAWPESWRGDAFIGDVGGNLVHHKQLVFPGPAATAQRPPNEIDHEFIASTDNWFRPVQFANAPDGCLYIADMYREVIEHPWSLPPSIKQHLDLQSGHDRGRVWRIAPDGFRFPKPPRLGRLTTEALVQTLEHENGWHRDTAARLLHQRRDLGAVGQLHRLLAGSQSARARALALRVLSGWRALDEASLRRALRDPEASVRVLAVRLSARVLAQGAPPHTGWRQEWLALSEDESSFVRFQLALSLGQLPGSDALETLIRLLRRDAAEPWLRHAVLYALGSMPPELLANPPESVALGKLMQDPSFLVNDFSSTVLHDLAVMMGRRNQASALASLFDALGGPASLPPALVVLSGLAEGLKAGGLTLEQADTENRLGPVFDRALGVATDRNALPAARRSALGLLALGQNDSEKVMASLWPIATGNEPADVQRAAWDALRRRDDAALWQRLWGLWEKVPEFARRDALAILLHDASRARHTLELVRDGRIDADLFTAAQRDQLRRHAQKEIQTLARQIFGFSQTPESRYAELQPVMGMPGDAAAGRVIYRERCASCHRLGEEGHALGPDLATVQNGGVEKILLNLVDPNREVAPNFVQYDIETRDGELISGIIVAETTAGLTVRQANGLETSLVRANVASMRSAGKSPMPEGLTEGLSPQDVADLLALLGP